jgi:hypothetical protein
MKRFFKTSVPAVSAAERPTPASLWQTILNQFPFWHLLAALSVGVCFAGCGPSCERGHYEKKFVAFHEESRTSVTTGGQLVVYSVPVPDHTEDCWVCDKFKDGK